MTTTSRPRPSRGFTLIETMCAVAVASVLASIAYPTYQSTVLRARRTDAHVALMQLHGAQERHRAANAAYGGLSEIRASARSPAGHYALSVARNRSDGFEAVAAALGLQGADHVCRYLRLSVDGAQVAYASGTDAAVSNDAQTNRQCWGLR